MPKVEPLIRAEGPMTLIFTRWAHLFSLVGVTFGVACGFPRPADVPDDGDIRPVLVVRVSTTGDDTNDGLTGPVRTLRRAIGIAAANNEITAVHLAPGRYDTSMGESFPYSVPANVTVAGPAEGGAVLVGLDVQPGLMLGAGEVRDLVLEDFSVAVIGSGIGKLANIRVRSSAVAVRGVPSSKLTISGLEVTGAAGGCATGIELDGDAELAASDVAMRDVGIGFHVKDQSASIVSRANISADRACNPNQNTVGALTIATSNTFILNDSLVDGSTNGITFVSTDRQTRTTITNTIFRNTSRTMLFGGNVAFDMTGGEFLDSQGVLSASGNATWRFTNVSMRRLSGFSITLTYSNVLIMRDCTNIESGGGIYAVSSSTIDLGTESSPGNNILQTNSTGLEVDAGTFTPVPVRINAVGNTWRPNLQGADVAGRYPPGIVTGPVNGGNYVFPANWSMQL